MTLWLNQFISDQATLQQPRNLLPNQVLLSNTSLPNASVRSYNKRHKYGWYHSINWELPNNQPVALHGSSVTVDVSCKGFLILLGRGVKYILTSTKISSHGHLHTPSTLVFSTWKVSKIKQGTYRKHAISGIVARNFGFKFSKCKCYQ